MSQESKSEWTQPDPDPRPAVVRVLLADDVPTFRALTKAVLEQEGGFEVVGEAQDGLAAIRLAQKLQPDLVLLDLTMPLISGVEAVTRIRAVAPGTRVVLHSGHEPDYGPLAATIEAGAFASITKGASPEEMVASLRAVLEPEPRSETGPGVTLDGAQASKGS